MSTLSAQEWIQQQEQCLGHFAEQIKVCLDDSDWEGLPAILESRQAYLQQLFSESLPDAYRKPAKQLIESILAQDAVFQARIQEQRNEYSRQQLSLGRGLRAVQAYQNH